MSSPMVDRVRDIPLVIDRDIPMDEDSGFPFDDECDDQDDSRLRSQLDDIAVRHPEFAQHLGSFPFRSAASRARSHQIPEHFGHQRPFGERFERFGFPFEEEQNQTPYYQRYPKYYPQQPETSEQSVSSQEQQTPEEAKPEEPERERRPNNIQQSNTVDLGQPQEPVDDRNQRSMSAPPSNERPRFVSSINIPVNQPKENVSHDIPQMSQPQERVIPIHVEGRDEPIIPKKFASQPQAAQQQQQQPQPSTDKFFTQRSPNFSQYFNRDQPFQNDWFPRGFQKQQQQQQRGRSPQPQPKPEPPKEKPKVEPEEPKEVPKPQPTSKPDPIDQIKSIQKDVSELMMQVDQFSGKPKDKQYLYLDEMLTRNLIKLDNIDTQGQENIRLARKEAIKCIEKCISILETKANSNAEAEKTEKSNESEEKMDVVEEKKMDVDAPSEEKIEEKTVESMETTSEPEKIEPDVVESEKKMEIAAADGGSTTEWNETEEKKDEQSSNQEETEVKSDEKKEKKKIKKKSEKK